MPRTRTSILLALLICTLPSLGNGAETATPAAATPAATIAPPPVKATAAPTVPPSTSAIPAPAAQLSPAPATPAAPPPPASTTSGTPATPSAPAVKPAPTAALPLKVAEPPRGERPKLGYLDIARVSAESSLGKASAAQAKQKQEKLQAQVVARRKQLDKQKAAIEAQMPSLQPAQREAKAKEFQKKVESFQKFGMGAEKELQTLQEGLGKAFNEAVSQAAAEYGKANGLALVVVKRELLYLAPTVDAQDVSEGIIKLMDERFRKK